MTTLALSFHSVHLNIIRSDWQARAEERRSLQNQSSALPQPASAKRSPTASWGSEAYTGGTFVVFDWERNQVTWQIAIDGAAGFCLHNHLLYVVMMRLGEIVVLDGHGQEQRRISHPALNNLHTIVPTSQGFLLTSTGTDSIIELDQDGQLLYTWCALDHGYALMKNGQKRIIDASADQRYQRYATDTHTTHVNSARFAAPDEKSILATLFHQGTVIVIDRATGQAQTLVTNLVRPHEVRPYPPGGWVLSDTGNNQALLLDQDWQVRQRLAPDLNWVQCAIPLADGSVVIADTNNHRLVRLHPENPDVYEVRMFPFNWRIYLMEEVTPTDSGFFQHPIASAPL